MRWREAECGPGYDEGRRPMERGDWRPRWPEARARAEQLRREAEAADRGEAPRWSGRQERRVRRHRTIGRGYRPGSRDAGPARPRRWLAHERRFEEPGYERAGEHAPRGGRYPSATGEPAAEGYAPDYERDDRAARRRAARRRSRLAEWYDEEFRREPRGRDREGPRLFPDEVLERYRPHKAVGGFSARGIHTYDLDYGRQAGGPTTEYSGRAGLSTSEPVRTGEPPLERDEPYEWPYTAEALEDESDLPRRWPRYEESHWSTAEPAGRQPRRRRRRPYRR